MGQESTRCTAGLPLNLKKRLIVAADLVVERGSRVIRVILIGVIKWAIIESEKCHAVEI